MTLIEVRYSRIVVELAEVCDTFDRIATFTSGQATFSIN